MKLVQSRYIHTTSNTNEIASVESEYRYIGSYFTVSKILSVLHASFILQLLSRECKKRLEQSCYR